MKSRSIPARAAIDIVRFQSKALDLRGLVSVAALTLVCIVVLFYATDSWGLSDTQDICSTFGDYLGNILSVAFSSVSLTFARHRIAYTESGQATGPDIQALRLFQVFTR